MTTDRPTPPPTDGHPEGLKVSRARLRCICWMLLFISLSYVIVTAAWISTENRSLLPVMELLTIWSAVAVLLFMIEIHRGAVHAHRSGSLAALLLTAAMAAVTISNHFLYLTVLPQLYPGTHMPAWLLLDGWPSITKGLECVAWGLLLGLAMVFAATPARRMGRPVEWTLRISGAFALAGLIGPATGNMNLYLLSTAGYSLGFLLWQSKSSCTSGYTPWASSRCGRRLSPPWCSAKPAMATTAPTRPSSQPCIGPRQLN